MKNLKEKIMDIIKKKLGVPPWGVEWVNEIADQILELIAQEKENWLEELESRQIKE